MITTENLYMRLLEDTDLELLKLLWAEDPQLKVIYSWNLEMFEGLFWENAKKSDDEIYLIFKKDTNEFCGKIELQHPSGYCDELGIALLKSQQNKGIGPEAIVGFGKWLNEVKGYNEITVRIDPENKHSQHVFEKMGAEFTEQKSGLWKEIEDVFRCMDENLDLDAIGSYFYKLYLPIRQVA